MSEDKQNWMIRFVVNNLTQQQVEDLVDRLCDLVDLSESAIICETYQIQEVEDASS